MSKYAVDASLCARLVMHGISKLLEVRKTKQTGTL